MSNWSMTISARLIAIIALISPGISSAYSDAPPTSFNAAAGDFRLVPWSNVVSLVDDQSLESLRIAAQNGLRWLRSQTQINSFDFGIRRVDRNAMVRGYEALLDLTSSKTPTPRALLAHLQEHFDLVESRGQDDGSGMLSTGYYVPHIDMKSQRQPGFDIPVYRMPPDLVTATVSEFGSACQSGVLQGHVDGNRLVPDVAGQVEVYLENFGAGCATKSVTGRVDDGKLVGYWTRGDIRNRGVLDGKGLEVGWVADEVSLFFVEVQGSAALEASQAQQQPVQRTLNYENGNGRKYRSIGRLLVDEGRIPADKISMQTIREYLANSSPAEVRRVLDYNESFVFFRVINSGAHGCFDYEVTAGRSVALDQSVFPSNAIGFLDVERPAVGPDGTLKPDGRIQRVVFNQDTGGAIRGPGRVDLFWGSGEEEERLAGIMQSKGRLFLFVPK